MKTIPLLINALQHSVSPKDTFRLYNGTDWSNYVSYAYGTKYCYPTVLWRQHNMELLTMGWYNNQTFRTYTNYNIIYSHILQGHLFVTESDQTMNTKLSFLQTHSWHSIPPFSIANIKTNTKTASLHLFHYSYSN